MKEVETFEVIINHSQSRRGVAEPFWFWSCDRPRYIQGQALLIMTGNLNSADILGRVGPGDEMCGDEAVLLSFARSVEASNEG